LADMMASPNGIMVKVQKTVADLAREVEIAEGYERIAATFARIHRGTPTGAKLEIAHSSAIMSTLHARAALRLAQEAESGR
jgi:recombinational DNA repair protein RecR